MDCSQAIAVPKLESSHKNTVNLRTGTFVKRESNLVYAYRVHSRVLAITVVNNSARNDLKMAKFDFNSPVMTL